MALKRNLILKRLKEQSLKQLKHATTVLVRGDRRNITEFIDSLSNDGLASMDNSDKKEIPVEYIQDIVEKFLCM